MAGSLATDKRYPGIGRISRRTGTTDRKVLRRTHAAMDEAYSMGRSDLLKRIRDRDLSVQEFYTASKQGKLKSLRSANDIKPLKPTEGESPLLVWATGHSAQEYASYIKM